MTVGTIGTYNNNFNTTKLNNKTTNVHRFTQNNLTQSPKDTVQISANNATISKKKKGMSNFSKFVLGLIGAAGALYAGVVGHRKLTKPSLEKCAKNFSEIFRRDISKDEAQKMITNYQELFKIKDHEEFCKKAFEQVKKDYGYEKLDIPLKMVYRKENIKLKDLKKTRLMGTWDARDCSITYYSIFPYTKKHHNNFKWQKKDIIEIFIHEFQHAKQSEISYRTSPSDYIKIITRDIKRIEQTENDLKNFSKNPMKYIREEAKQQKKENDKVNEFSIKYYKLFGNLPQIKPNSNNYKLGKEYMENERHYINMDMNIKEYKKQILEKEAYSTGAKFDEIYNYFANPWRLF